MKVLPPNGKRGCVERDFVLVTFISDFFTPLMKSRFSVRLLCRARREREQPPQNSE